MGFPPSFVGNHFSTIFSSHTIGTATPRLMLGAASHHCSTLQHTATHCNTLQHTATYRNTLQHTVTHCYALQHLSTTEAPADAGGGGPPPVVPVEKELSQMYTNLESSWGFEKVHVYTHCRALQGVAICCSALHVLQCVSCVQILQVCGGLKRCLCIHTAECCRVLQFVAVCCTFSNAWNARKAACNARLPNLDCLWEFERVCMFLACVFLCACVLACVCNRVCM